MISLAYKAVCCFIVRFTRQNNILESQQEARYQKHPTSG
ncbi:hypothetical protein GBAR_LOCUS22915, partial [Geodia barretti]